MTDIAVPVHQTRAEGTLGASDAACALGLDRYRSPIALWRQLRGLDTGEEEKPAAVREAAEWGQALEPIVRGKYALTVRRDIVVPFTSTVLDGWIRATPDGFVLRGESASPHVIDTRDIVRGADDFGDLDQPTDGILQCKTASAWKRDEWEAGAPAAYEIQCRVEMAVCDLPWDDLCCLLGGQRFIGPIRIERDAALEDRILTSLRAFWELVTSGREPSPDHTADWRRHVSEKMRPTKVVMQADDEIRELVAYLQEQKRKADKAEEEADAARNDLLLRMSAAGATGIDLGDGRKVTAYQVGARPAWKEYALSLGGDAKVPEQFRGKPGSWALMMPGDE